MTSLILNDKVYDLTPKRPYHCRDCDAFPDCTTIGAYKFCSPSPTERYLLRLNPELTQRINRQ